MKRNLFIIASLVGCAALAPAQTPADGVAIDAFTLERNGAYMTVDMNLDLTNLKVESNRAVLLTPRLVNENDSIDLPAIGIYGRRRYYYYVRNFDGMISGPTETSYKASEAPATIPYNNVLDYQDWMNGATLKVNRSDYGCCRKLVAENEWEVDRYFEPAPFVPELVYVTPAAEAQKSRSLEGSAFIDFPVNKTFIRPDYRNNTVELAKIQATIDSVRGDNDITITQVWLKGFASPESPYSHNRDLAIGRTAALKDYIQKLYKFADGVITTDYEPEDWAGLRRFVENSNLEHRTEILALIDSDREPDAKEWKIKSTYPEEYRFMLQTYYPALRHTDYRIAYDIRSYSDVEEIKRVMATAPQKLSLNEFYLVAQTYEAGTPEFTDVFETAVRLYPNDEAANLNAANAELARGDYAAAAKYLAKAGTSAEVLYARGVLAYRNEDYAEALRLLEQARQGGVAEAEAIIEHINSLK